ncbi:MAG: tRNA preQ1(34) S-adenosylmethionine ribosyltransferase-isomerase QueA [Methylophilaceae bacterium]
MNIDDFNYNLPENLIAQSPLKERRDSRLLIINPTKQTLQDSFFKQFTSHLSSNDLVIFNDTKVIKARLFGKKLTGGKVELLIERIFDNTNAIALIKTSKTIKSGIEVMIDKGVYLKIISRKNNLFHIRLNKGSFEKLLKSYGHIPLPPYIQREDEEQDMIRYQTIYAKNEGAVAAPTAGLHFSQSDFKELNKKNITTAFLTLHVGSGTFQPVKVSDINDHIMHEEVYYLDANIIDAIAKTKAKGGRIIAIGTTVLRALESAFAEEVIKKDYNVTKIFIKPGFKFKVVDALFTNFHLPKSTLLMLISAFAGSKFTKKAYNHAIEKKYRFFSYGDAMFIEQKDQN